MNTRTADASRTSSRKLNQTNILLTLKKIRKYLLV